MHRTIGLGMSLTLVSATMVMAAVTSEDPLLTPIEPDFARRWLTPQPATRIFGNTYVVGFGGLNIALIDTNAGLILIDGGVPQGVRAIEANIRSLGFALKDVKLILSTEPHYDHAGGLAALERDSGATIVASVPAADALRAGRSGADDPQIAWLPFFPPVRKVRPVGDGETLRLGDVRVTAVATPGHTAGSMSWRWRSCEDGACADIVFASSLNPVAAPGYRFSDPAHRGTVDAFRASFAKMRAQPCTILLSAHPEPSDGGASFGAFVRQPKPNPFIDRSSCRAYADRHEQLLDEKLAVEKTGSTKP
ncbi:MULTISPECIES: subclass B3 metallo-beta-lactamase [unclassified Sphingomonas]|uniref:subclass B3 metallo-beta-lactamase n=1 Tax=unclassified Sphingomonas TaxID=196159 RepID=UPI0006FDBD62|nr:MULTISPECIES: subclass B3 metallo-beta-lactamase [unclassified Sphingomonas]KQX19573.1 subclass B3 metallo-beta-lactamase [Sphingomonas sp. Root1294]KQY65774.1 subclass B3 metallo-beta-lactamase [Sphingomonas sp. Root50]KRB94920.1 subclass B3 metallo-beta-lactamase [Sphingomonas sp. Root720]